MLTDKASSWFDVTLMFKDKESMKENFVFWVDYKPHSVVRFSEQAGVLQPVPG